MDILHVIIESDGGSNSAQLPLITIFGSHSFPHNVWGWLGGCTRTVYLYAVSLIMADEHMCQWFVA